MENGRASDPNVGILEYYLRSTNTGSVARAPLHPRFTSWRDGGAVHRRTWRSSLNSKALESSRELNTDVKKVSGVRALPNHTIWVRYEDGIEGVVDLSSYSGRGVFTPWSDPSFFANVHVSPHGSIAWNEDIGLCPDSIYLEITGKRPGELFERVGAVDVDA